MVSCEKCWWDAHTLVRDGVFTNIPEAYSYLIKKRNDNPCTPKEQAGQFWDEEKQIDIRLIKKPEEDINDNKYEQNVEEIANKYF
jgi:hypothetical protein